MKFMRLSDGGQLAYRESGSGQALVLIHGWGLSGDAFSSQLRTLSESFRVIVPDLRGHGQSSAYGDVGFNTLADDLLALFGELELVRPVVVGWSLGALVAWQLAHAQREALAGLVTIDMVPRLLNDSHWAHGLRTGADRQAFQRSMARMTDDWQGFTRVFVPRIFATSPAADDARLRWLLSLAEGKSGSDMATLWGDMVEQDLCGTVRSLALPALHIYGERSRLYTSTAARWLADQMPSLRLAPFANSGHAPHLEEPDRFDRELLSFARSAAVDAADERNLSGLGRTCSN